MPKLSDQPAKKRAPRRRQPAATMQPVAAPEVEEGLPIEQEIVPKKQQQRSLLSDVGEQINILYYGDAGTGKTTNLATMANAGKIVVVNAEGGLKARPLRKQGVKVENIEIVPEPGVQVTFDILHALYWDLKATIEADPSAYVGIVWDSITEIQRVLLRNVADNRADRAERQSKGNTDRFQTELADYGRMTEELRELIRWYRDLPVHFGASALERRDTDDDGAVAYRPALTPALALDLYGYVDVVVHTDVADVAGELEYRGAFQPVGKYRAKDRLSAGALPRYLVTPTFERVSAYVEGKITQEDDEIQQSARAKRRAEKEAEAAKAAASSE